MSGYLTLPPLAWGPGAVETLSALAEGPAAVVVDPAVAAADGARRLTEELAKGSRSVTEVVAPAGEPTVDGVARVAEAVAAARPAWLVAVGGGSVLDTARAARVRLAAPGLALRDVTPLSDLGVRRAGGFVAVPTTVGSGGEASWSAHLLDADRRPIELRHRDLLADWALLDAGLTATLAPAQVAAGVGDLLAHALEATASAWANPFSDALAREAIVLALGALPRGVGRDAPDERAALLYAGTLAGAAAANAALGVGHALALALGARLGLPHARLSAALLPYVVEFNYPVARERYAALGPAVGAAHLRHRSALTERLRAAWREVGLPRTLAEAGVAADRLDAERAEILAVARAAPALLANPRIPDAAELGRLLDAAMTGAPVGF